MLQPTLFFLSCLAGTGEKLIPLYMLRTEANPTVYTYSRLRRQSAPIWLISFVYTNCPC